MHCPGGGTRRGHAVCGAGVSALLILIAPALGAQTRHEAPSQAPLTLQSALERFRSKGFDLLIADTSVAEAAADVTTASAVQNPQLSLARGTTRNYDPSQCAGCSSTSVSASITDQAALSDLLTGKRRLRVKVARVALGIAQRGRADTERTLETTVKQQVLQAELAKQSLANARDQQRLATDTLRLVGIRYKAGAISEADVARADVQKLEADQAVDTAVQSLESAQAGLAYLLGYERTPDGFDVSDDLVRSTAVPRLESATYDDLLRDALAYRPDLAAAALQIARAESSLALARRQRIPDFYPSLAYSAEGTGQNAIQPPTYTFGIAANLPIFYRNAGEIARAGADLQAQKVVREKVAAQVGADVGSAFASYESAKSRVSRMDASLLSRAARARDLVRLQYEKGAASLFEFLDAQRTWLATQAEYLQNLNDYWTAVFQLEQAAGEELRP